MATIVVFLMVNSVAAMELGDEAYKVLLSNYGYDATYPLNAKTVRTFKKHEMEVESIIFDSFLGGNVPGFFATPSEGKKPYPVVLLLHGMSGSKAGWLDNGFYSGRLLTESLLKKGYAVLALDAQYHGDRGIYNNLIDAMEMISQHGWGFRTRNMITQTVIDYRRAIDYLETREEIDASRIGILGYSMGGQMSFILGATEPRIKTIVACVVPELEGVMAAPSTFTRSLGDKSLLMLMARKDRWYSVASSQKLFDSIPGNNKAIQFYNSGHKLPTKYTQRAVDWITEKL